MLEAFLWVCLGAVVTSICWMFGILGMSEETEAAWVRERDDLLHVIQKLRADLSEALDKEVEARGARAAVEMKLDELRDALYRVHDVSRAWCDEVEAN